MVSATEITATSPPALAGPVDVVVTTDFGASPTVTADEFTYGRHRWRWQWYRRRWCAGPTAAPVDTSRQ